ncbi:MAG: hypothetical protein ACT4QE_09650 [Anaerolineales bacterium]
MNGRIELWRRWWYAPQAGSVAPADAVVDRRGESVTPGVREMGCRENQAATSFDKAAENLARTAQIQLSGEQLRLLVEAEGRRVQAAQQAAAIPTAWTAAACEVVENGRKAPDKTRVYVGCDGVMAPIITHAEKEKRREKIKQKRRTCGRKRRPLPPLRQGADQAWKEFKVVYFYSEDLKRQHVAVTHQNHEAAGRLLRREANRLDFRRARERIAIVDGAPWIREQLQLHMVELDGLGLDFYHLGENVHRARRVVFAEDDAQGTAWADQLMHAFKHDPYDAVWERLVQWRAQLPRSPRKRRAADRLLEYVSARREMIRYPEFRASGWQIGSGPTEAQCKLTVGRLKGRSRRWDRPNAAAVAALDSLERSGQWHHYVPTPCTLAS